MKNKSVKTMVASVLAVGLMMGIPASAFAVSPGGMSVPSAQSVDSSENCAQILDWLGIQIPRHFDSQAPYKINTLSESDPNYWQDGPQLSHPVHPRRLGCGPERRHRHDGPSSRIPDRRQQTADPGSP